MAVLHSAVLVFGILVIAVKTELCSTPNSTEGECIDIDQCQPLLNAQDEVPLSRETAKFLRRSQCGFDGTTSKVCCQKSEARRPFELPKKPPKDPAIPSFVNRFGEDEDECGVQYRGNRIFDGTITDLEEFPWMALLAYETKDGVGFACGGVLISKNHVLTAAHCVIGPAVEKIGKLVAVRFGEYDIESAEDCDTDYIDEYCAPTPVDAFVESAHPHPDYRPGTPERLHDIAIVKLKNAVNYTEFVKPICLPTKDKATLLSNPKAELVICGWGQTEKQEYGSTIKLKAKVPVVPESECKTPYEANGIRLARTQVCAGGGKRDSCKGDSGGPLMLEDKSDPNETRWYAMGIISFGAQPCAKPGVPAVYTRTVPYLEWIESTMKL